MAGDKTEKATPKKREEARKKGQVARSADLNGSLVLLAGLLALGATGSTVANRLGDTMRTALLQTADPSVVDRNGIGRILLKALEAVGLAVLPVAAACAAAALVAGVAQVGFKPSMAGLKPDPKRINPVSGAKNLFGPNSLVELVKSLGKVGAVGAVVFAFVAPHLTQLGAMVGISPIELSTAVAHDIKAVAMRAAAVYLLIGLADVGWQRHRHEKSLKMDLQEVKEEAKQAQLPAEVRSMIRRRQVQAARARMMADVPTADVVVTNPTHFAVALKYDGTKTAPEVIAKGQDLLAQRIKEIAREAGIPIVEDKPLARSLHATVEVGHEIPEELFQAVAAVLAYVYRLRGSRPRG